jgi:hypothetical protein
LRNFRLLQRRTEHPEREHIEKQVPDAAMQKQVGRQLPERQVEDDRYRRQRQHRDIGLQGPRRQAGQDENRRIDDQQPLDSSREVSVEKGTSGLVPGVWHGGSLRSRISERFRTSGS